MENNIWVLCSIATGRDINMIKLINKDGLLCIVKGNGDEEICKMDELKSIRIEQNDILVETAIADISFEIERAKSEEGSAGCGGGCGGCGSKSK